MSRPGSDAGGVRPQVHRGYARANRQKPSTIISKESVLRIYLVPRFGQRRLDMLTHEDIQRLKADLKELSYPSDP